MRETRIRRFGGGAVFEKTAVAAVVVAHTGAASQISGADASSASRIERMPAPSETTALRASDSAAGLEEQLASDREADAANPVRFDVGTTAKEPDRGVQVFDSVPESVSADRLPRSADENRPPGLS